MAHGDVLEGSVAATRGRDVPCESKGVGVAAALLAGGAPDLRVGVLTKGAAPSAGELEQEAGLFEGLVACLPEAIGRLRACDRVDGEAGEGCEVGRSGVRTEARCEEHGPWLGEADPAEKTQGVLHA